MKLTAFVLMLQLLLSVPAAATTNVKLLVERAKQLSVQMDGAVEPNRGQLAFQIEVILDTITKDHPRSLEAAILKTGKLLNTTIDVFAVSYTHLTLPTILLV